jgi:hypothetical protein
VSDPRPPLIQTLLTELDRALAQPLAPWRLYSQWLSQRQLLQRLRDVLSLWPTAQNPIVPAAATTTITDVRSQLLAPLQADIQQLLTQRQALQAEVAALTRQRSLQQAQIMAPLIDQVEQLELFQQRTNQMIQAVDGSMQLTFRVFDQDLEAYRRGLVQRLDQLDDLSQQSETIVATLLQQVIQEVQQLRQLPPAPPTALSQSSPDDDRAVAITAAAPISPTAVTAIGQSPPAAVPSISQLADLLGELGLTASGVASKPIAMTESELTLTDLDDLFLVDP